MTAVFLLCTIILFVLQTLSMKLQHAEHLPQKLLVNCAFSLLAAAAMGAGRLAVPDMFTVSPATLRHGIAFGVLFALTILFYNLAIASGPLSYTTFYFSASMLVPAFAGVLLFGEALTFTLAAAVALFLAAFWCLNVAPGGAQKPEPRWLALCALTFLCNGLCAVVQKSQQNATGGAEAAGLMLVGFCTAAACYALAYLALRAGCPRARTAPRCCAKTLYRRASGGRLRRNCRSPGCRARGCQLPVPATGQHHCGRDAVLRAAVPGKISRAAGSFCWRAAIAVINL
ncbi:MAG: hypothetical protein ACLRI7_13630 [Ruthenibacterium lactatiformans]